MLYWCQIAKRCDWQPQHDADCAAEKVELASTSGARSAAKVVDASQLDHRGVSLKMSGNVVFIEALDLVPCNAALCGTFKATGLFRFEAYIFCDRSLHSASLQATCESQTQHNPWHRFPAICVGPFVPVTVPAQRAEVPLQLYPDIRLEK